MTTKTAIAEGVSVEETSAGIVAVQTIDVPASGAGVAKLYNGLQNGAVPRIGAALSGVPGVKCTSRRAVESGPSGVRVTVRFEPQDAGQAGNEEGDISFSVQTEIVSEESIYDIDGRLMKTSYVGVTALGGAILSSSQIHRTAIQRPTFALDVSRVERASAFSFATRFSGTVNRQPWQGKPAKTWLLRIGSQQIDATLHRISYNAVYNPRTWMAELIHTIDGFPPPDIRGGDFSFLRPSTISGNGIIYRDVYPLSDFGRLGLPRLV